MTTHEDKRIAEEKAAKKLVELKGNKKPKKKKKALMTKGFRDVRYHLVSVQHVLDCMRTM